MRCAKAIAPASFGALLQLPKDQLRELAEKQPTLKAGLREYVMKKAGNKARVAGLLDIFSDDAPEHAAGSGTGTGTGASTPPNAPGTPSSVKAEDSPSVVGTPLPDVMQVDATPPPA